MKQSPERERLMPPHFVVTTEAMTRLQILLLLPAALLLGACRPSATETDDTAPTLAGTWQLREVSNGVTYTIRFIPDDGTERSGRIEQHFSSYDGYSRDYPGTYSLRGDTLTIDERRDRSLLRVSSLTDTLLLLIRSDSAALLFDRRADPRPGAPSIQGRH